MSTLEVGIYTVTLAINFLSLLLVYRQRVVAYPSVRMSLLCVYLLSIVILVLEFGRLALHQDKADSFSMSFMMKLYAPVGITVVLLVVILLTVSALGIYLKPRTGGSFGNLFRELLKRKRESIIFFAFTIYVAFSVYVIDVFQPYRVELLQDLFAGKILSIVYQPVTIALLGGVLAFFLVYPTPLFFLTARKIADKYVRRNLMILPICYVGVGADLLALQGYLTDTGVSANAVVYLIWGALFAITALVFRNASVVSSFFEVNPQEPKAGEEAPSLPFSKRLPLDQDLMQLGNSILLEVDPTISYEEIVRDFSTELMSNGYLVFVFTSKGTPIFSALSRLHDMRFYILSASVSYMKPTEDPLHVLIPQADFAMLLDAVQKTSELAFSARIAMIFDNLSDMMIDSDFDSLYKFLKRQNEAVNDPRVTRLFLMIKGAQDARQVNLIKSLFPVHLVNNSEGLRREK